MTIKEIVEKIKSGELENKLIDAENTVNRMISLSQSCRNAMPGTIESRIASLERPMTDLLPVVRQMKELVCDLKRTGISLSGLAQLFRKE